MDSLLTFPILHMLTVAGPERLFWAQFALSFSPVTVRPRVSVIHVALTLPVYWGSVVATNNTV